MCGFKRFILAMSTNEARKKIFPVCVDYIAITLLIFMGGLDEDYFIIGLVLYIISTILVIVEIAITVRNIMKAMFYE